MITPHNAPVAPVADNSPNANRSAAVGLVVGCVIFGLGSLIVAHVNIGGYAMAFWRLAVSGLVFSLLIWLFEQYHSRKLNKRLQPVPQPAQPRARLAEPASELSDAPPVSAKQRKQAGWLSLLSGVFLGWDLALWHESIYAVGPGISTLLNSLQIFFLAVMGYVLFAERQTPLQFASLLLAFIGVVCIASPEFAHNGDAVYGFVTGIVSASMLAASMTCIRLTHQASPMPTFVLMQRVSVGGCVGLIVPMLWFDYLGGSPIVPSSLSEVGWILVYGTVMQCMAWGLIAYSIPKLSLSLTGLLLLSEPVAAVLIDYFWLDKPINELQWLGTFVTMLAIYLGSLKPKSTQTNPNAL